MSLNNNDGEWSFIIFGLVVLVVFFGTAFH